MPFSSYSDLQSAIAAWLGDDTLTSQIPDFIRLFEAAAARRLRVRPAEKSATLATTSGSATLPSDFLAVRTLKWVGTSSSVVLDYVTPAYLDLAYPTASSGAPRHYTIQETTLKVRPVDDSGSLSLLYIARTPALATQLQWLFNSHPDVYLFGSLCEAEGFVVVDPARMAMWKARRDEIFAEILELDFFERAMLAPRVDGPVP
jgi:hypothetical protein